MLMGDENNKLVELSLTHLSLASHKRDIGSADLDQMPQNAASDQGPHCLH